MPFFGSSKRPGLEPDWMYTVPRRLAGPASECPRALLAGETILLWGEGLAVGLDADSGSERFRAKLGSWKAAGPDPAGRLVLVRGERRAVFDLDKGEPVEVPGALAAPLLVARDTPESPEEDPRLRVGDRLLRVRTETRTRVTRHWIEVTDFGTAPQRVEVAAFTLRTDRLTLTARGEHVYGWAGMDPECPTGALVAHATGPVLILKRRFPAWHEHGIPEEDPDLVGHGPAHLGATIVIPGTAAPKGRELGTVPETWEGLGYRGSHPPYLAKALGARPIGAAGGRILIELTDLDGGSPDGTGLAPRQRFVAAFSAADLLS